MARVLLGVLFLSLLLFGSQGAAAAPLHEAAKAGDIDRVQQLINEGVNLDAKAGSGTALHWAILKGHDGVAARLIEQGASVDIITSALGAPLHVAASKNNTAITLLLLEHGANPNVRRGDGFTPLHVAAEYARERAHRYPDRVRGEPKYARQFGTDSITSG
jgi:ankyrin repeat protein